MDKVRKDGLLQTYQTVKTRLDEQAPIGYSSAGVVIAAGELASGVEVGDRVACAGAEYANHAEVVYVPSNLVAKVPDGVDLADAAYSTVGAIAMQGVRQAGVSLGDCVAVIGLGLLGQLAAQMLRAAGCRVAGIDLDGRKCELALGLGAEAAWAGENAELVQRGLGLTGGRGFDAVIITAGTSSDGPVELAGELCRDRGTVVVVGDVGMKLPRKPYYEKELTLRLARSYGPGRYDPMYEEVGVDYPIGYVRWTEQRNMQEFLQLVASGAVKLGPLTTHRFPVDEAAQAYEQVQGKGEGLAVGVLLEYPERPDATGLRLDLPRKAESAKPAPGPTVGVSLVGAGNFATATLLPGLERDGRAAFRGILTGSGLSASDTGAKKGFSFATGELAEILGDDATQAVVIASRHDLHAAQCAAALGAGKTVFVEKPLCLTREEFADVVEAWRRSPADLMVGFNRRFSPLSLELKAAVVDRSAPAVITIRANAGAIPRTHWTQRLEEGGGRILGEACHFIDLACYLAGAEPVSVYAAAARADVPLALRDTLTVILSFANGSVANVTYAANGDTSYPKERVEVFCEGGVWVIDDFKSLESAVAGTKKRRRLTGADKGHRSEMRAFLDLVQGRPSGILSFADCAVSTAATFAVIESLTSGVPVAPTVPSLEQ
jgi:predicted dehydrogenase/threonine dehydrogenase-like Zn-dependent dehydrogenase